jgi:TetR/AcrR family fatty acid metabolism transcriptional regulator
MIQPLSKRAMESRKRLLKAAVHEFARKGYHLTKISDIVSQAGFTQRTFYIYFPSKEAIYDELISIWRTKAAAVLTGKLDETKTVNHINYPGVIRRRWEEILCFMAENPDLTRMAYFMPQTNKNRQFLLDQMVRTMTKEQNLGHIRPDIPIEILAESVLSILESLALRYLLTGLKDASTIAACINDLVINGTRTDLPKI